jgi:alpha-1,3-glucan synthase
MVGPLRPAAAALISLTALLSLPCQVVAHEYREDLVPWNLNNNQDASSNVLEYSTSRRSNYTASPQNWRELPFYTLLLDKFADGDPSNNDFFNTTFEHDINEVNLRYGGDVRGLHRHLDYLQGMGIRAVYIAGTPFLNMPWQADSYSALDFTLVDPHWGTIADWQAFIDELHSRGMYIMADFTVGTMGDYIGFKGYVLCMITCSFLTRKHVQPPQLFHAIQYGRVRCRLEAASVRPMGL